MIEPYAQDDEMIDATLNKRRSVDSDELQHESVC
jgi:hypothetical protein